MNIKIDNITKAQEIAIEDMLATWTKLGGMGSSRWTAFFADGDGNFRPYITVDGRKAERTKLLSYEDVWKCGEYRVDFDTIAWRLRGLDQKKGD